MKFQFKLILTYGAFLFVFVLALGIYLLQSNTRIITEEYIQSYTRVGEGIMQQLEGMYDQMDFVILNLLSQEDFKSAMTTLETVDRNDDLFEKYYSEAASNLKSQLFTYSLQKKYHSIIYFNRQGDFFSSNLGGHPGDRLSDPGETIRNWESLFNPGEGTAFVIPPYRDRWGTGEKIFGLGRVMRRSGQTEAFLIAQENEFELSDLFSLDDDENVDILVFQTGGNVFYGTGNFTEEELSYYRKTGETAGFVSSPVSGQKEKLILIPSSHDVLEMVIIINQNIMARQGKKTRTVIFLGILSLLAVSLLYDYISSRMLTRPLAQITEFMNGIELDSLPGELPLSGSHDEIAELNRAFHELIKRLDDSTKREIQVNTGWIQAKMDALQEQVNPHFLYNILTVISQKAYTLGDKEICRTCDDIASMLRYSTSTASRHATLRDEREHAKAYLSLMKRRLGGKLGYKIEIEEDLLPEKVPKIILQPLVENALNHGYQDVDRTREITITGKRSEGEWTVSVRDNGQGYDTSETEERFRRIRENLDQEKSADGLQIGGLGLANTYARLYLTFGKTLIWELRSREGEGTEVIFGTTRSGEPQ